MPRAKWGFDDRNRGFSCWSSTSGEHKSRTMRTMTCMYVAFLDHPGLGVGMDSVLGMELALQVGLMGSLEMRESLRLAIRCNSELTLIMQMNLHRTVLNPWSFQSSFLETKMSCELSPRFVTHHRSVICKEEFYNKSQIIEFIKLFSLLLQNSKCQLWHVLWMGKLLLFLTCWCHYFLPMLPVYSPGPWTTQPLLLETLASLNFQFKTLHSVASRPYLGTSQLIR